MGKYLRNHFQSPSHEIRPQFEFLELFSVRIPTVNLYTSYKIGLEDVVIMYLQYLCIKI